MSLWQKKTARDLQDPETRDRHDHRRPSIRNSGFKRARASSSPSFQAPDIPVYTSDGVRFAVLANL